MNARMDNISRRLARAPMLAALVPLIAGILWAGRTALPLWGTAVGLGVCILAARLVRQRAAADAAICAALFFAGWSAAELRYDDMPLPAADAVAEIKVRQITSHRHGRTLADGDLIACRTPEGTLTYRTPIRIAADSAVHIAAGERIAALCRIRPFSRRGPSSYERYMARRGFAGQVNVSARDIMERHKGRPSTGSRLRTGAVERIRRLGLPPEIEATASAVSVGERSGITSDMRRRYSLSGAAHLLAVSGLHVGFVFAIVNMLLWWMPALRRGHLWRCAAAVAAIWLYAAVAGFSPSVTRAAVMFTLLQLSAAATARADTLNSLALAACILLLADARTLFDAGFLLSFIAVAAIVEWGVPLDRLGVRLITRRPAIGQTLREGAPPPTARMARGALRWLWGAVAVSLTASLATLPLVAAMFGTVSLWSVATGPPTVALSAVLLGATLVWTLVPLPCLTPAAAWIIGAAGGALDAVVRWCAEAGVLAGEVHIGAGACAAAYAAMVLFTLYLWSREGRR